MTSKRKLITLMRQPGFRQ